MADVWRRDAASARGRMGHAAGDDGDAAGLLHGRREKPGRGAQDHGRPRLQRDQAAEGEGLDPQHLRLPRSGGASSSTSSRRSTSMASWNYRQQHLARQGDAQGIQPSASTYGRRRRRSGRRSSTRTTAATPSAIYTQYCNKDVDALIDKQSQELDKQKRQDDRVGDRAEARRGSSPPDHPLRSRGHLLAAVPEGLRAAPQQHLQQLALRGRVAGQVRQARA